MIETLNHKKYNINLDSDGLLSYLFLKKFGLDVSIGGYNISERYIWSVHDKIDEMWEDIFLDIFSPRKGVTTIDQHIITTNEEQASWFRNNNKINPHLNIECHHAASTSYFTKFPFQTALFVIAMLEREGLKMKNAQYDAVLKKISNDVTFFDIILRADGVLENFVKYKDNVISWAEKLKVYSNNGENTTRIISYLLSLTDDAALAKTKAISDFYIMNGLTKDGGYNNKRSPMENMRIIIRFVKSFQYYLGIDLCFTEKPMYEYAGIVERSNSPLSVNCYALDTYAFVGKERIQYTKDIKSTGNNCKMITF